jgi:hypothetical protein
MESPGQVDTWAGVEAQVRCQCRLTKWVPYALRHAGNEKPPAGTVSDFHAWCDSCPHGSNFTTWTGQVRYPFPTL